MQSPLVKGWEGLESGEGHTLGGPDGACTCGVDFLVSSYTIRGSVRGRGRFGKINYGTSSGRVSTYTSKPMMHKNSSRCAKCLKYSDKRRNCSTKHPYGGTRPGPRAPVMAQGDAEGVDSMPTLWLGFHLQLCYHLSLKVFSPTNSGGQGSHLFICQAQSRV